MPRSDQFWWCNLCTFSIVALYVMSKRTAATSQHMLSSGGMSVTFIFVTRRPRYVGTSSDSSDFKASVECCFVSCSVGKPTSTMPRHFSFVT